MARSAMSPSMQRPRRAGHAWLLLLLAAWALWEPIAFTALRWSPGRQGTGTLARPFSTQEAPPLPSEEELVATEAATADDDVPPHESLTGVVERVKDFGLFVRVQGTQGLVPKAKVPGRLLPLAEKISVGQEVSVRFEDNGESVPIYTMDHDMDVAAFRTVPGGQWLTALVRNVNSYGLHVEVEHPESGRRALGLVHLSRMSRVFISQEELSKSYSEGQEVRVRVAAVDGSRISLSMLDEEEGVEEVATDLDAFRNISSDALLTGNVARILPTGAQVRLADPPGMGILHVSGVPGCMLPLAEHFKIGQEVSVRLVEVSESGLLLDLEARREEAAEFVNLTAWVKGFVNGVRPYGLFVDVEHPDSGGFGRALLQTRNVPWQMLPLSKHFKEGQEVSVQVAGADKKQLGVKMAEPEEAAAFLTVPEEKWLEAVVTGTSSAGLHVFVKHPESGGSIQSLVHVSNMLPGDFEEGQEVAVRIESVDVEKERIGLTMREAVDYAALAGADKEAWLPGRVVRTLPDGGMLVDTEVAGQRVTGILPPELASKRLKKGKEVQVRVVDVSPEKERVRFTSMREAATTPKDAVASPKVAGSQDLAEEVKEVLERYGEVLSEEGYDSVGSLRQLSREEWQEMKEACKLRPGHAAKLRAALHPDWA